MGSPLLRAVRPHSGAATWITRRRDGRVCLAHRVEAGAVAAVEGLRGLRHGHIAATLGVATVDGAPYALVELRPCEPLSRLRDRLARAGRAGLPAPVMVRVAAQIADAVAALHARGLCHGAIDARRVAVEYSGGALLLDTPQNVGRGAAPADDIAGIGRLIDALTVGAPAAVVDLARRAREGAFVRAADLAAALDAWRRVDPEAAAVDDGRVARWMSRVCAARLEVWRAAGDASDGRGLDALVALIGPPRELARPGMMRAAVADTAEPTPAPPPDEEDVFSSVSAVEGAGAGEEGGASGDEPGGGGDEEQDGHVEVEIEDPTGALSDAVPVQRRSRDVFSSISELDEIDDIDEIDGLDDMPFSAAGDEGLDEAAARAALDALEGAPGEAVAETAADEGEGDGADEAPAPGAGRAWGWVVVTAVVAAAAAAAWWWLR
ncbi:MAG: hypothetical protein H6701_16555 [Myxococcales bacterium]|nr:hypothetical protein [Myxococcales bacterium]